MRHTISHDNFKLELVAYGRDYFETGMSLVFAARHAMAWAKSESFGLIFFEHVQREEGIRGSHSHLIDGHVITEFYPIKRFDTPLSAGPCTLLAWDWLQEYDYKKVTRNAQIRTGKTAQAIPYVSDKGFRIYSGDDGRLGDHHGVICHIEPTYLISYQ